MKKAFGLLLMLVGVVLTLFFIVLLRTSPDAPSRLALLIPVWLVIFGWGLYIFKSGEK